MGRIGGEIVTVRETIMSCCKDRKISLTDLAEMVGMTQGNLSRAISRAVDGTEGSGMKVSTFIKLIEAAGGEIFIQSCVNEEYYLDGYSEIDEDERRMAFPTV